MIFKILFITNITIYLIDTLVAYSIKPIITSKPFGSGTPFGIVIAPVVPVAVFVGGLVCQRLVVLHALLVQFLRAWCGV